MPQEGQCRFGIGNILAIKIMQGMFDDGTSVVACQ